VVDDSPWPVVILRVVDLDGEGVKAMLTACDGILDRRERHASVFVIDERRLPPLDAVRRSASWLAQRHDDVRRYSSGVAFVCSSAAIRGSLRVVFRIVPPPVPTHVGDSLEVATHWARERRGRAG
jgi:hypothetical protein